MIYVCVVGFKISLLVIAHSMNSVFYFILIRFSFSFHFELLAYMLLLLRSVGNHK